MKILVIEDQMPAALVLMATLRTLGHEVEHVQNSESAWARLNEGGYRVVVSDWRMPGVDGLGFCRMVRAQCKQYVYFILVSVSRLTRENRKLALDAGVDDFLMKPVDPDELGMRLHVAERIIGLQSQVHKLGGMVPICGFCKKVREDEAYWKDIEAYIAEHDGTNFSHGVCPACYEQHYAVQLRALKCEAPQTK